MSFKVLKKLASLMVIIALALTLAPFSYADDTLNEDSAANENADNSDDNPSNSEDELEIDDIVESLEKEGDDASSAEEAVEDEVAELAKKLSGKNNEQIAILLKRIESRINNRINALNNEQQSNPDNQAKIERKIKRLQAFNLMLRARLLKEPRVMTTKAEEQVNNRNNRYLYEIRWGNLTGRHHACEEVDEDELKTALDDDTIPEDCHLEDATIKYEGEISVNTGEVEVYKTILFENNDQITVDSGTAVQFNSNITGHNDGLLLKYTPGSEATNEKVQITLKIGSLNKTFDGNEILGRHDIGNGQFVQIKPVANILPSHAKADQDRIIENKIKVLDKTTDLQKKVQRLRLLDRADDDAESDMEDITDDIDEYNFDEETADEIESEIKAVIESLDDNISAKEVKDKLKALKDKLKALKDKAKERKFRDKLIPFRDTDDNDWFTEFASAAKERGIFTGYKDAAGNDLGEFRPGRDITVAEILKVGLETSGKGQSDSAPKLGAAINHWAKGYVKKAEELNLDIINENDLDLNRPATRGEVVRMMLEAAGVTPEKVNQTDFSDVPANSDYANFIQYAKELGIISGDSGKTTFRPNEPINRAEAAKIANLMVELFFSAKAQ